MATSKRGIRNEGNTCFIGASIQSMLHNPAIYETIGADNVLWILKSDYERSNGADISPMSVVTHYARLNTEYKIGMQMDALEAWLILQDSIAPNGLGAKWNITFGQKIECHQCACVSHTTHTEPIWLISINEGLDSLEKAISKELTMVILTECYSCQNCTKTVSATKTRVLEYVPPYFGVALKRFRQDGSKFAKDSHEVEIDQVQYMCGTKYQLSGFISHIGELNGGHYVYHHRHVEGWYLYNDQSVQLVGSGAERSMFKDAYILFYKTLT